jgi:hypothetical protein
MRPPDYGQRLLVYLILVYLKEVLGIVNIVMKL